MTVGFAKVSFRLKVVNLAEIHQRLVNPQPKPNSLDQYPARAIVALMNSTSLRGL